MNEPTPTSERLCYNKSSLIIDKHVQTLSSDPHNTLWGTWIGISTILQKRQLQLKEIKDPPKVIQVKMAKPGLDHKSFTH